MIVSWYHGVAVLCQRHWWALALLFLDSTAVWRGGLLHARHGDKHVHMDGVLWS